MITKIKWADRGEWQAIRGNYIGGSDAAAVIGLNPYRGAFALWLEKTGKTTPYAGNLATETGALLEGFVADLFTRETGKKVRKDNHTMVNDLYPFACANVDRRVIGENAILECKTTNSAPNMRKFRAGEYPETWYCQMMHYMAVTEADRAYLAVLISCRDFKVFVLERDQSEIDALMDAERRFWNCVETNTPPEPNAFDGDAVSDYYPAADAVEADVDLTAESDILREYETAKAEAKAADERAKELQARICAALGDNTRGHNNAYIVKWTPTSRSTFDVKRFAAAHPDIDTKPFYTTSVTRRFSFDKQREVK